MKKFLINYYSMIMMTMFIVYNILLDSLKIGGLFYRVYMTLFILLNAILLITFRKDILCKKFVIIVYFLTWIFSKNGFQCFFNLSNIIILCITGFMENNFIKIISACLLVFFIVFFLPLYFVFLLAFGTDLNKERGISDIYEDTHYYCDHNYEVYSYSAGAMDKFHYSIGKYYEVLHIDGIIYITYSERNEKTQQEYENYLYSHNCWLVGD